MHFEEGCSRSLGIIFGTLQRPCCLAWCWLYKHLLMDGWMGGWMGGHGITAYAYTLLTQKETLA